MKKDMLRVTLVEPQKLKIDRAQIPVPSEDEIMVKVSRVGVCGSDLTIYNGNHPYVDYPLIMGHEYSGEVECLGKNVEGPSIGTRVAVIPHLVCGECRACKKGIYNFCEQLKCTGAEADGAHVEYICVPQEMVIPIPDTMTFDDAALIEPACVAYHGAKRGEIKSGDNVLIFGAGPIGIYCMQSCKALGAGKVYMADLDQWRLDLALKLGADGTIDSSKLSIEEGFENLDITSKEIDVFYDCVGGKGIVLDKILEIAARGTRVVMIGVLQNEYVIPHLPDFVQHELRLSGTTMYVPQDYIDMIKLMDEGTIKSDGMITHYYKLEEIEKVFEMIKERKERYLKVMLTVNDDHDI